jgi:hypothetical protein
MILSVLGLQVGGNHQLVRIQVDPLGLQVVVTCNPDQAIF